MVRAACTLIGSASTASAGSGAGPGQETAAPLRATCIGVSGTIKKLQERVIRMDRRAVQEGQRRGKVKAKVKAKKMARKPQAQVQEAAGSDGVGV